MNLHLPNKKTKRQALVWRWAVLGLTAAVLFVLGRSSLAEFEVPPINTTGAPTNVEFRGVWAFNRGTDNGTAAYNQYEAFAVGIDTAVDLTSANNGVMYFYNGNNQQWSRVTTPFTPLTATVFSLNAVAGRQEVKTGTLNGLWVVGAGGRIYGLTSYQGIIGSASNQLASVFNTTKDLYAVDAAPDPGTNFLAGGKEGILVGNINGYHTIPITATTPQVITNITGIKFVDQNVAYVTTSTVPVGKTIFDRACDAGQISKIYKVDFTLSENGTWTNPRTVNGNCFYGLTAAKKSDGNSVLWIASEYGLWRFDTVTLTWTQGRNADTSLNAKPFISAVAIDQGRRTNSNLLYNGDLSASTTTPVGWTSTGASGAGDTKARVNNDNRMEVAYETNPFDPSADGHTVSLYQTIPLTTFEGQRFKVSGDYAVTFNSASAYDVLKKSQGGVVLTCAGSEVAGMAANYVNCSVSNRKLVVVKDMGKPYDGGANPADNPPPMTHFEMIVSREDGIFSRFERGDPDNTTLTKRKMDLQIRCEATYGAKVECDNLKVEAIDEPPLSPPANDKVLVIAAGKDLATTTNTNGIVVTEDGLATPMILKSEAAPPKARLDRNAVPPIANQINAMFAVGSQHIFAVGQRYNGANPAPGLTIFSRTSGTLAGNIWVGAGSATAGSTGAISVSCSDANGVTKPTLCETSPEAYGLSLEITSNYLATRSGSLTGRAWFGTPTSSVGDRETMNLGTCERKPAYIPAPTALGPYRLAGMCDSTTRRCKETAVGALSAYSCINDFDCYGRCQKDEGFLCAKDADCQVATDSFSSNLFASTTPLNVYPARRLICDYSNHSPLACTGNGWLTFNSSDATGWSIPRCNTVIGKCFENSAMNCTTANETAVCPLGSFGVSYNTKFLGHNTAYGVTNYNSGAHELSGWGRFMTMADAPGGGWVHMRSTEVVAATGNLFACKNCDGGTAGVNKNCAFCLGKNTTQNLNNLSCVPSSNVGVAKCYNECQGDTSHTRCSSGAICFGLGSGPGAGTCAPGFCAEDPSIACTTASDCASGTCAIGAACLTTGSSCVKYGVNLDTEKGKFYGSAWSADFGWLDFGGLGYGGQRILQTKLGDVYATGAIGKSGEDAPSSCNATYLITSGSTINGFCSAVTSSSGGSIIGEQPYSTQIPLISAENSYQNILGRFDIKGMETSISGGKNKYGSTVSGLTPTGSDISDPLKTAMRGQAANPAQKILGGNVYTVGSGGSYIIDSDLLFYNSDALTVTATTGGSGAGILIVNGDLTINADIKYLTAPISDLRQLASLTIVVKGNLTIKNSVQNIVGAYYVQGTVKTVNDASNGNIYPLRVDGLMIAQAFEFKRQFAGTVADPRASELIIYDGRLQSNPLPGMVDFTSALPNTVE